MTKDRYALPAILDMGNSAIRVLVADALSDGSLIVVGVGEEPAAGLEEGRIVDLEKVTECLKRAMRTAEIDSGRKIHEVHVAVSGEYIHSYVAEGKTVIHDGKAPSRGDEGLYYVEGGAVSERDLHKVREMAVASVSDSGVEVLDVICKTFKLDRQANIRNPVGMRGRLLSCEVHLIVAERQNLENMEKCIAQAGMVLAGRVVFSGLASARAVLKEEEKRLGVCLLDIGAHTTEMVIFHNGGVYESDVYVEASNLIHMDISQMHHTTLPSAEKCKKQVGVTVPPTGHEMLKLISTSGEEVEISHSLMLRTATSRVEVLLESVEKALRNFEDREGRKLTAGLVLTGGGAMLPGLVAMATNRLHIPVRVGTPAYGGEKHERLKTPHFASAMGLLMMMSDSARQQLPLAARLMNFFFTSIQHTKEKKHHGH